MKEKNYVNMIFMEFYILINNNNKIFKIIHHLILIVDELFDDEWN